VIPVLMPGHVVVHRGDEGAHLVLAVVDVLGGQQSHRRVVVAGSGRQLSVSPSRSRTRASASSRDTCTWEIPIRAAICSWVWLP
jgi:hypothetical protein